MTPFCGTPSVSRSSVTLGFVASARTVYAAAVLPPPKTPMYTWQMTVWSTLESGHSGSSAHVNVVASTPPSAAVARLSYRAAVGRRLVELAET